MACGRERRHAAGQRATDAGVDRRVARCNAGRKSRFFGRRGGGGDQLAGDVNGRPDARLPSATCRTCRGTGGGPTPAPLSARRGHVGGGATRTGSGEFSPRVATASAAYRDLDRRGRGGFS